MGGSMSCLNLEECIYPGTPRSIKDWILFINRHHNGHRTHPETVKSFRGHLIAQYIDFKKLGRMFKRPPPPPSPKQHWLHISFGRNARITIRDKE
jgi:hypothetical protein